MWGQANQSRGRRASSTALGVLAAVLLLLSVLALYANRVLFDSDQFANHVGAAVEKPAVKDEIGRRVTDGIVDQQPDLIAVHPVIEGVAAGVVGSGAFNDLLRAAVRDVHRAIFKRDKNTVTLTVADVGVVVGSALEQFAPKVAKRIRSRSTAPILDGEPPGWLLELARVAKDVEALAVILVVLAIVAAAGGLALAPDWRRQVSLLGISVAIGALVALIGYQLARSAVAGQASDPDTRAAVEAAWDTFLDGLQTALLIAAGAGVILAAATRAVVRPVRIERPVEEAWRRLTTVPERPAARVVRGAILVAVGVLIILNRDAAIELAVLAVGLYVLYKGVEELLRLIAPPAEAAPAPAAERAAGPDRRRLRVALGAAGVLFAGLVTAGVISTFNTTSRASPSLDECNGSARLCDVPLADAVLPAAHNAMSGADIPEYLFASQDHRISRQLDDGVRGLLIDTHYGIPADGGAVKTDLGKLTSAERREYVEEIGQEAFDAALRIRDRLVTGGDAGHQIYMCHRFCELGAVPLDEALGQIRDFVVSHRNQVLVIVNEDYVSAENFVAAVKKSGLDEYVYRGRIDGSSPTLGEMISSGRRVILMAENEAGAEPWYRDGYGDVLQETPYRFKQASELTDPRKLARTCEPNRGSSDNPLFLLNHWIDTSPAPKPSNAAEVNDYKTLLARAQECEKVRGQVANLIAVDFYATGDLFNVVEKLNGVSEPTP
ncbi:MAG: hypothetical protein AABM66_04485 [Actinomycetota bacterium]